MYEDLEKLSSNALHNHLTHKMKLHADEVKKVKEHVAQRKERRRVEKITRTLYKKTWQDLLSPLRYELNNAKVGMQYQAKEGTSVPDAAEQRIEAFTAYIAVMERLLSRFELPAKLLETLPSQIAKERNDTKKGTFIPNNGQHWTDWVPSHIKESIAQAFDDIPRVTRAKRKIPFQRTVKTSQHNYAKVTLFYRTLKEKMNAELKQQLNPTKENADVIRRISKALDMISQMSNNEAIPPTWYSLNIE